MSGDSIQVFADLDFTRACEELDEPQVDDWELFTQTPDIKIYRQYDKSARLYSYKVYGELNGISPEVCRDVYMDLDYRKKWDSHVKELTQLSIDDGNNAPIYWQVNYPFPMSNRDYVFLREKRELELDSRTVYVILAKSIPTKKVPHRSGVVRVTDYIQSVAMTDNGNSGTKAFMRYFENPGGSIPTWLINWAAKVGVSKFMKDLHRACTDYKSKS